MVYCHRHINVFQSQTTSILKNEALSRKFTMNCGNWNCLHFGWYCQTNPTKNTLFSFSLTLMGRGLPKCFFFYKIKNFSFFCCSFLYFSTLRCGDIYTKFYHIPLWPGLTFKTEPELASLTEKEPVVCSLLNEP